MGEARDKQELFKEMILELKVSNETLSKIQQHTLNTADLSLDTAIGIENSNAALAKLNASFEDWKRIGLRMVYEITSVNDKLNVLNTTVNSVFDIINSLNTDRMERSSAETEEKPETESDKNISATAFHTFTSISILEEIATNTRATKNVLLTMLELQYQNALQEKENKLEQDQKLENKDPIKGVAPKMKNADDSFGILGMIAGIAGLVTGFVLGVVEALTGAFMGAMSFINKFLKIDELLAKMGLSGKNLKKLFGPLEEAFTDVKLFFSNIGNSIKSFFTESGFAKSIGEFFSPLKELFTSFTKEGSMISKILGYFSKLKETFSLFFKFGRVLGKIAGWVGIAISVVESITDAVNIFKTTGDVGKAIQVGITGFINSFTGGILDLFKDGISWIANMLGFEELSKALDSFSFADIISVFIDRIIKWGQGIFETLFLGIYDVFEDLSSSFAKGPLEFAMELIRGIMKTLVAMPLDIVKNTLASALGLFGASSAENYLRSFSFQKMMGGTHTQTIGEEQTSGKSVTEEAGDITAEKTFKKAEEKKKKEDEDKTKKKKDELDAIKNPIENFYEQLIKAYKEGAQGNDGNLQTNPSTVGATIAAVQSDTADARANTPSSVVMSPGSNNSKPNVSNSNSSVTYNSNNVPDRTSWMLTPFGAAFSGL